MQNSRRNKKGVSVKAKKMFFFTVFWRENEEQTEENGEE